MEPRSYSYKVYLALFIVIVIVTYVNYKLVSKRSPHLFQHNNKVGPKDINKHTVPANKI